MLLRTTTVFFAAAIMSAALNASTVFDFDNLDQGTATNFTDTVNGLSATFSSSADPGGFVLYPSFFETLTGNVLGDPGPASVDGLSLDVAFSSTLNAIDFDFATADFGAPSPVTITAYDNATEVGSNTLSGQFLSGFTFPEGELAFDGPVFNNIVISSTGADFAVDNLAVNVASAPEPSLFMLAGAGLCGLGVPALRKRRRATASK